MKSLIHSVLFWAMICFGLPLFAQNSTAEEVKRIAVLQLTNRLEMSPAEIEYLTGIVRLEAAKRLPSTYLVMTQENIVSLLPPDKTLEDCQSECEVDMGRLLGARYIITGEVLRFGSSLRLTMRLHNTETGRLISSEIAKGKQIEDLEEPTALAIQALLQSLNPQGVKERAEQAILEIDQKQPSQEREKSLQKPALKPKKTATTTPLTPKSKSSTPSVTTSTAPTEISQKSKVYAQPRYEIQLGLSIPQCSENGEFTCEGFNDNTDNDLNDFGIQYKVLQLSSVSFGIDLRFSSNTLQFLNNFLEATHVVKAISTGIVTTYATPLWFARMQLGLGGQKGGGHSSYQGAEVRFGLESGFRLGILTLSLYAQNEVIPKKTEICFRDVGNRMCADRWAPGIRQIGIRMGVVWGE